MIIRWTNNRLVVPGFRWTTSDSWADDGDQGTGGIRGIAKESRATISRNHQGGLAAKIRWRVLAAWQQVKPQCLLGLFQGCRALSRKRRGPERLVRQAEKPARGAREDGGPGAGLQASEQQDERYQDGPHHKQSSIATLAGATGAPLRTPRRLRSGRGT